MGRVCSRPLSPRERDRVRAPHPSPLPEGEGTRATASLFLLLLALLAHCQSNNRPDVSDADADVVADADADADVDSDTDIEADGDIDMDTDIDIIGDPDIDEDDVEFEAEAMELCGEDDRQAWSFRPYDCRPYERPRDCCASCQQLTCREAIFPDIWGDLVAYQSAASVAIVDLATGEDRIVFPVRMIAEDHAVVYLDPAISSRYVVAWRSEQFYEDGEPAFRQAVVARSLTDLSGPEILLDDSEDQESVALINVYEEWAVWGRHLSSTGYNETVLHNIETGEHRIIDRDSPGHSASLATIWGDRVVWGTNGEMIEEYRISTGETRIAFEAPPEMQRVQHVRIWDHYAIYNPVSFHVPWEVILVDLDTGEARVLALSDANKDQASIHNNRVIWTDHRGSDSHLGMHIHIYSLRTDSEYVLNPSARAGADPVIFDRTVVWSGLTDEGVDGIWVTRIGDI
jgi:hypothetical protein